MSLFSGKGSAVNARCWLFLLLTLVGGCSSWFEACADEVAQAIAPLLEDSVQLSIAATDYGARVPRRMMRDA